jgi:uncharacterized protein
LKHRLPPLSWVSLFAILFSMAGQAAPPAIAFESVITADKQTESDVTGYLARIEQNSPEELERALKRAEMLFLEGALKGQVDPAIFVIHGPEVAVFFKDNYPKYRSLVDLAARLTAFKVIDIRVCETRMGVLGRERNALMPFVGTVPFGPAEEQRLVDEEGYVYF